LNHEWTRMDTNEEEEVTFPTFGGRGVN